MIKNKKFPMVFLIILVVPVLYFLIEWCCFAGGIKRVYYNLTYNKDRIRVIENNNFLFYEEGYTGSYKLNSKYYVPHRILLIPESKLVPVQYEFDGEILIEIYDDDNKLLYSFKVNKPKKLLREGKDDDYYGNYLVYNGKNTSHASSIFAFELGEIPFDLIRFKWNRLKNMKIKITVLRADKCLKEFCDRVALVIIPNLSL